jgi:hypothetical protein
LLGKLRPVNGSADGARGKQMLPDPIDDAQPEIRDLAACVLNLLALAFGPRGLKADINWMRIVPQEQGMDSTGRLYALHGSLRIDFVLPALPYPRDDDETNEIPF